MEQNMGSGKREIVNISIQNQRHATEARPVDRIQPTSPTPLTTQKTPPQVSQPSFELHQRVEEARPDNAFVRTKQSFSRTTFDSVRISPTQPALSSESSHVVPEPESSDTPIANVFSADAFREKHLESEEDEIKEANSEDIGMEHASSLTQSEVDWKSNGDAEGVLQGGLNVNSNIAEREMDGVDGMGENQEEIVEEISQPREESSLAESQSASEKSPEYPVDHLENSLRKTVLSWSSTPKSPAQKSEWEDPIVFAPKKLPVADVKSSRNLEPLPPLSHIRESETFVPQHSWSERSSVSGFESLHQSRIADALSSIFRDAADGFRAFLGLFQRRALPRRTALVVLSCALTVAIGTGGWQAARRGMALKGEVLGVSTEGYAGLEQAISDVKARDFSASETHFADASVSFARASDLLNSWGTLTVEASRFIPGVSQLASGSYLADAAKNIAEAGQSLSRAGSGALSLSPGADGNVSFLETFQNIRGDVTEAEQLLSVANDDLDKVKVEDLPEEKRATFLKLRTELPTALAGMRLLLDHGDIFSDMLGKNGPRRFLFLFQNNHEMRATGGFIGSYAYLDVANGRVRNFFVDGIFNPDGQLKEDIVPPVPIQKISAGWSLHDSNWFPNFPTSAEKAIFFYEKTGGPTVDGVVAITPEVLKLFLEITGPIRLDQYDVTVDSKNFIDLIQYQVEVAYDREENRPKKILADLAPILLGRLFGSGASAANVGKTLSAIEDALSEKHILFYSRNADLESLVSRAGWSGEVLPSSRDYLSVINTNINGFKTDGVVKESVEHHANIGDDGTVTDTVTITRRHTGGQTGREWWDAVNADYMRVYVPLGSELVSAEGYTRETVAPPLDYDALHFSRDADVEREESSVRVDPVSGTRISEDAGKTVFGNWVYVSPGEEVRVTYTYRLPFRIDPSRADKAGFDSYSAVFQKQSGSFGSELVSTVSFPSAWHTVWQSDAHLIPYGESTLRFESDLTADRFLGLVLSNE